ncbi:MULTISPECIES: hypothetical protein [unclassified Streptomyces]|uniref:hypothetical protein n=1 Tax=unclassified Streptomyces TaxID=2593676 RepID=UPI00225018F6|nr:MULTISPECIES: hypothetical protein [unclassified Streptomyces]MCX5004883.1 hypothetical protein [Streptomyces sp. NBC_00638]
MGASAAVLCLGGALAACAGDGSGGGYVAVGAAGGSPRASGAAVAPSGEVSLVPLRGESADGSNVAGNKGSSGTGKAATGDPGSLPAGGAGDAESPDASTGGRGGAGGSGAGDGGPGDTGTGGAGGSSSSSGGGSSASSGGDSGRTGGSSGHSSAPPGATATAGPAVLGVSDTSRAAADHRWCEKVTVSFRNTGGTAVRSGTVTFGTHIIGSLGIDWATIGSTETLPAPIAAGARKSRTWTVCVDAWRVPLGMHIETRDVSVRWK